MCSSTTMISSNYFDYFASQQPEFCKDWCDILHEISCLKPPSQSLYLTSECHIPSVNLQFCREWLAPLAMKQLLRLQCLQCLSVPQRERVFAFRDFVLRRFGPQIFTESARLPVLDVAGGKGDLSWLLKNADGLDAVVVDPRVTDHTKITRTALWHYQILCVAPSKLFF